MAYLNKTQTPFITMYIKENYCDIDDFITQNEEIIYDNSIQCFKALLSRRQKKVTFYIQAICHGVEMDMEFMFSKDNIDDLNNKIIPFYERNENYEKCQELLLLYKELSVFLG